MRQPVVVQGSILTPAGLQETRLGFDPTSGLITAVGDDVSGELTYDLGDRIIVPGAIDLHVHFRDPGHPDKEDFGSGTLAAACGGVTTVYDMPNTEPPTTSVEAYADKRRRVAPKAHVDFGLFGGITRPGDALRRFAARAGAFKIYLGESTGCVTLEDIATLPQVFDDLRAAGFTGLVSVHAEDRHVMMAAGLKNKDAPGLDGHDARRPPEAEAIAILSLFDALDDHVSRAGPPRFRVHVAHVSTSHALRELEKRPDVSFGVTPHHLLLDRSMDLGANGRVNPPLRSVGHAAVLWDAFTEGNIPILESDHAPHTRAEKARPVDSAPSGLPGVETMVPLMMARVVLGQLTLDTLVHTVAETPARLLRLPKGRLEPGRHADLAVYDLGQVASIDPGHLHSKAGWTPYAGMPAVFPTHVWLRGRHIVADGVPIGHPGTGEEVTPLAEVA